MRSNGAAGNVFTLFDTSPDAAGVFDQLMSLLRASPGRKERTHAKMNEKEAMAPGTRILMRIILMIGSGMIS